MYRIVSAFLFVLACAHAQALDLGAISNQDAATGLKQALSEGASAAVQQLGAENGYFGNAAVKIPLPASLQKGEKIMRMLGMQKQADDLVLAMNRAAESAVVEARPLLVNAVKTMTVQDAKGILTGGDTAATDYFRAKTETPLAAKFLPVIKRATAKVGLAEKYNAIAGQGAQLGLLDANQASIEQYVTQKALAGLYVMIGEHEKALRQNPVGASTDLVKKVFGALH